MPTQMYQLYDSDFHNFIKKLQNMKINIFPSTCLGALYYVILEHTLCLSVCMSDCHKLVDFSLAGEGGGDGRSCFCSSSSRLSSGMHSEANAFKSTLTCTVIIQSPWLLCTCTCVFAWL